MAFFAKFRRKFRTKNFEAHFHRKLRTLKKCSNVKKLRTTEPQSIFTGSYKKNFGITELSSINCMVSSLLSLCNKVFNIVSNRGDTRGFILIFPAWGHLTQLYQLSFFKPKKNLQKIQLRGWSQHVKIR